jgi:hypothetical protein
MRPSVQKNIGVCVRAHAVDVAGNCFVARSVADNGVIVIVNCACTYVVLFHRLCASLADCQPMLRRGSSNKKATKTTPTAASPSEYSELSTMDDEATAAAERTDLIPMVPQGAAAAAAAAANTDIGRIEVDFEETVGTTTVSSAGRRAVSALLGDDDEDDVAARKMH